MSDSLGMPPTPTNISVLGQRLAWARNVQLFSGFQYNFTLNVPTGADYDLYLYNTTGDAFGEPVIVANSTTAVTGGFENITYAPPLSGEYYVVVKRATEGTGSGQFTLTSSVGQPVHLLLSVDPYQATYAQDQSIALCVNVLNQYNPPLNSTLTLSITGPSGYYYLDSQSVNVTAEAVGEYSFNWNIPSFPGTYIVEVSLVPPQLTAYDAAWLQVT